MPRRARAIACQLFKSSLAQTLWSGSYPAITFSGRFPSRVAFGVGLLANWGWRLGASTMPRHRPRTLTLVTCIECPDALAIVLGQSEIVPAVEEARATNRIDCEVVDSIAADDHLLFQVNGQRKIRHLRQ